MQTEDYGHFNRKLRLYRPIGHAVDPTDLFHTKGETLFACTINTLN